MRGHHTIHVIIRAKKSRRKEKKMTDKYCPFFKEKCSDVNCALFDDEDEICVLVDNRRNTQETFIMLRRMEHRIEEMKNLLLKEDVNK